MKQSNLLRLGEAGKLSASAPAAKNKNLTQKTFQVKVCPSNNENQMIVGWILVDLSLLAPRQESELWDSQHCTQLNDEDAN